MITMDDTNILNLSFVLAYEVIFRVDMIRLPQWIQLVIWFIIAIIYFQLHFIEDTYSISIVSPFIDEVND